MKKLYKIIIYFLSIGVISSCGKWVDVKPTDRLGEDQLFVNSAGFIKALNGVYVEMAHQNLYGQNMSTGALDVLAQYYYIKSSTHVFEKYTTFMYTDAHVKATMGNIWGKAYELIANCNVILDKCGDGPSKILAEPYYGIVKGETLALRAMLHLDMLRLFGPIYNEDNKLKEAIPYVDKSGFEVFPLLGSQQVMEHVINDLIMATSLLEMDPVRTEGVRHNNNAGGSNDLYYRQYRLNYYAAKALLARAYLWKGERSKALECAEEILSEVQAADKNIFPYVTFADATNVDKPDRLFSTEVMFALYDINRQEMYKRLFDVSLKGDSKLSFSLDDINVERINATYDDGNDFRRRSWQSASTGTITATTNMKYADIANGPGRYMVPLIRLSEVLLIAAECHPDLVQATAYFNKLRTVRNCVSLEPGDLAVLKMEIGKEFRREMLGEGQMFFFYKRNNYQSLPNHTTLNTLPEKTMVLNNYVVPLPDSETAQRQ
ncbi:RagB/SusD family nutrient uptake outer membrane protein [Sphingobacterium faecale]|uniref:RagB/SusD family nutrient uptake outer membrane protein n=1 Tax=Sphingobacterium faecale TaxID=2803775 RepID=A0ABS1QXM6_9SPHI|nr:RagB/SusD family nutrient uptake outer membrane protein [Sphingobacterium faecale]MBL1407178.1 RagB/SusD family nutrient uptake outer membrane protein [Sphingobacterium faecale]